MGHSQKGLAGACGAKSKDHVLVRQFFQVSSLAGGLGGDGAAAAHDDGVARVVDDS